MLQAAEGRDLYIMFPMIAQASQFDEARTLVLEQVERQVAVTKHRERITTALTQQSALVLVDDLDQGLDVVDAWAAEHLEILTRNAADVARRVRNAGGMFVGGAVKRIGNDEMPGATAEEDVDVVAVAVNMRLELGVV